MQVNPIILPRALTVCQYCCLQAFIAELKKYRITHGYTFYEPITKEAKKATGRCLAECPDLKVGLGWHEPCQAMLE